MDAGEARQEGVGNEDQRGSRKVLAVRFGRGRTGGSTGMDFLIQRARRQGRRVLIGDGDRRNATLARFYPETEKDGASQPATDELADVKEWITGLLGQAAVSETSLVLDMGGGDRALAEYHYDLQIVEFAESYGLAPLGVYFCGPDMDDFDHVVKVWRAGYFRSKRSVLFMNEHLVRAGKTPAGAFERILERPEVEEMAEAGMTVVLMPRLACMNELREKGLSLFDAAAWKPGVGGRRLDPVRAHMVDTWLKRLEEALEREEVTEWLP